MTKQFSKIAVIGAGTMGAGIAQVLAQKGLDVSLVDIKQEYIDKGIERINKFLSRSVEKGKMSEEEKNETLSKIKPFINIEEAVKGAEVVIEAIVENEELKKDLFKKLDSVCSPDVILASNTSAISISALSEVTSRPEQVVGIHFFNPPAVMKLVEIIKGKKTSEETVQTAIQLCDYLGKTAVPSNEAPGFIVNRLLWKFLNEAYKLLEENVATKEGIDRAIKLGLNHPMGPFELSDYIGLDVMLNIGDYIASKLGEEYKPRDILRELVKQGKLGRKTGEGFYKY